MRIDYRSALIAAALAIGGAPGAALATETLAPAHVAPARPEGAVMLLRPDGSAPHALYGTLERVAGTRLLLRTRAGRAVRVDDSVAVKKGMYSAPLFVGKTVLVEGNVDATGTFLAARVTRLPRSAAASFVDR